MLALILAFWSWPKACAFLHACIIEIWRACARANGRFRFHESPGFEGKGPADWKILGPTHQFRHATLSASPLHTNPGS